MNKLRVVRVTTILKPLGFFRVTKDKEPSLPETCPSPISPIRYW